MTKWLVLTLAFSSLALAAAGATDDAFVRGSITGAFVYPQMKMPRADAWAKALDAVEEKIGHDGALEDVVPGMGFALGYGVTLGGVFRFDANVANIRTEHSVTYTGDQYKRDLTLTTHILPVRLDGTFITPGFWDGRFRPEMGLGFVAFIVNYDTAQDISAFGVTTGGTAWTREVCYGPELKLGAEITIFDGFAIEAYGTYWTAEATLDEWRQYGDTPQKGPTSEDFTGWAIWVAPRLYL